ncbi:hypothetical protein JR316_0011823 [Psilocybe cubensis]|uniref:PPPDE domain-containing protein n=2 Tax=Psilocybe cubensis TaxID=181762 RepID=A0A8H7XLJ0_PSICU|nr:hypothetical protein JR316_0011823 [Psilocybe cubensis]KAH9476252.1 hypothetical protein JR316_0011823 [Psilocybe cubensis]
MSLKAKPQTYPELVPEREMDVKAYLAHLIEAYGGRSKEDMTALRVVKVSLMKNIKATSAHESLLVELRDPKGETHFLYFERGREDEDKYFGSGGDTPVGELPGAFSSSTLDGRASDTVTLAPRGQRSGEECMCHLEFENDGTGNLQRTPDKRPSVYNIALIANILNKKGPRYHLWNSNCFHFAGLFYDTLKKLYTPSETVFRVLDGKWRALALYVGNPEAQIMSVIEDYHDALHEFEAEIAEHHLAKDKKRREAEEHAEREAEQRQRAEERAEREAEQRQRAEEHAEHEAQQRQEVEARFKELEEELKKYKNMHKEIL